MFDTTIWKHIMLGIGFFTLLAATASHAGSSSPAQAKGCGETGDIRCVFVGAACKRTCAKAEVGHAIVIEKQVQCSNGPCARDAVGRWWCARGKKINVHRNSYTGGVDCVDKDKKEVGCQEPDPAYCEP